MSTESFPLFALLLAASAAVTLDDLVAGDPAMPYTLLYLVKRVQFESEVQRTEKLLEVTIEEHKTKPQDERLMSACTIQNPFVALHILETNILALDRYSLVVLTLQNSDFGFNDFRTFQRTLTKTANGLLHACRYCEQVKSSGNLTARQDEKLENAANQLKNVLKQAAAGAELQKKLFWPDPLRKAAESYVKDKLSSMNSGEVASALHKFMEEKYGDSENFGILGERFGVFVHLKNEKLLKKTTNEGVISVPFKESSILNVYRVSQSKVAWTRNYEAFEKHRADIADALANGTRECLPRSETLLNAYKRAFDAAASIYTFPAFYLVPNMIERDPNWAVENGKFQLDGDSLIEKVTIRMCADNSTLSVYYHLFVGF